MKFLIDAQLPQRLSEIFSEYGYDTIHTLQLPNKNRTTDTQIIKIANLQNRVIITKDKDFLQSHLLFKNPQKLIIITTGNISNDALLSLVKKNIPLIISILLKSSLVEISGNTIAGHFAED